MLSRVYSLGVRGVDGYPVLVEVDIANGLPQITTVGLPDCAVREARDRVIAAVRNSGFEMPQRRITVNLAPAQSRKQGTQFDLPISLALLAASGQLDGEWSGRFCFAGELALDGAVRGVNGALAMALKAKEQGFAGIVVSVENAEECAASGLPTYAANSLREVVDFLRGGELAAFGAPGAAGARRAVEDLSDVKGQDEAKKALILAAAGGHNILFIGPPGAGKSMLAKRLPGLLPAMTEDERLEISRVHAACGLRGLVAERPFRAPHHNTSATALLGGGPSCRPGEASLAHGGVLFLDELAEFPRPALEALRQPLEDRRVVVARAKEVLEYPAKFLLAAATNPCPCGHAQKRNACRCSTPERARYMSKLSGPLLDRIDLHVELRGLDFKTWKTAGSSETTAAARARVEKARAKQAERLGDPSGVNAEIPAARLRELCRLESGALDDLAMAAAGGMLSARAFDRVLRVARTFADLEDSPTVSRGHVKEALLLRGLERVYRVC